MKIHKILIGVLIIVAIATGCAVFNQSQQCKTTISSAAKTQTIDTENILIEKSGDTTIVTELAAGRAHSFVTRKVMTKHGEGLPAKSHVDNEILMIASLRGVIAVLDKSTGELYLI